MSNYVSAYLNAAADLIHTVETESGPDILRAAQVVADAIQADKDFLLFGSGHSGMVAREATGRAGGLFQAHVIEDIAEGDGERLEGMAALIFARYTLRAGSVIILISNSGINPVPIEAAQICKAARLTVIALTALAHSQSVASRHSSGKKLYELADIVIDTHGVPGDAALELPGGLKSGAFSTLIGCAIVNAINVQAAALLAERGLMPPVIVSSNVPGGDAHNVRLMEQYGARLVKSQVSAHFNALVVGDSAQS